LTRGDKNKASLVNDIDKEMCWIISNIVACPSSDIIVDILDNEGLLSKIAFCALSNSNIVVKEACYVISNILGL